MRWNGLAALLGGFLCLLLTPIQASIFSGVDTPPLVLASRPLLDLAGTIHGTFGPRLGLDEYYFYGRMFFLVYLGRSPGSWACTSFNRIGREERARGSGSCLSGW